MGDVGGEQAAKLFRYSKEGGGCRYPPRGPLRSNRRHPINLTLIRLWN